MEKLYQKNGEEKKMFKKTLALILVALLCVPLLSGVSDAAGVPSVNLVTPSPLEVYVGEQFAVVAEVTPATDDPIKLVARSSGNALMAESELISGWQAGVQREIVLYGKGGKAGLFDISQIQIVNGSNDLLHTLSVDALLIRFMEKPNLQNTVLIRMGTFSVTPYVNSEFALKFTLKNAGTNPAKNVFVQFNSDQAFLRGNSNVLQVSDIPAGSSKDVTVKMGLSSTESSVFRIPITVSAALPDGEKVSFEEVMTVTAADLGIKTVQVVGTPRVFLKKYTLSPSSILAGDTVTLSLSIENSSSSDVRNLKISLTAVPAESSTGGTVFSPVNSSNSFFVDRIRGKQTYTKSIDLYIDPNAAAKTYLVPVDILYEDLQGNSYAASEMISIPVLQESRLQVLSVDFSAMAPLGQPSPITAEFVNVGKVALKNLLVSIEGDFLKENASYFLASFEIGQSDYFQGFIIPQEIGLLEGKVVFKYTDNTNQDVVVEWPFQMDVQEMGMPGPYPPDPFPPDYPPDSGRSFLTWLIPLVVLGVILGVILIWRRKKKHGELFNEEL
jgi:hypothetical protein